MATQGLVSITKSGKIIAKIVAGSNGYNIDTLVSLIEEHKPVTLQQLHSMAIKAGFGGDCDLVVMNEKEMLFEGEIYRPCDNFLPKYWATFENPEWNPRWDNGTADYTEIIEM